MNGKLKKKTMTIRPDTANIGIIEKMEKLAFKENRSLNNYVILLFKSHIELNKDKIK
jgi:hypothetical protein